ncbi:MAG TPA: type IV pilus assembly protein PilM [Acidobacteriota bacterium]|jgi:type IV pilus assembly protein PilM|nr:type IV pilus assembly protein PilM [Acidobacteriota bacterium]
MLSRNKQLVGLDIGSAVVKAVELREIKNGEFALSSLGMERLPSDAIVDGSIISKLPVADAITKIFKEKQIKNRRIATSLSGHSVIVKKVTVPLQTPEELDESIQWEAEQYIPFEISDVHIDYHILKENPAAGNMDIILVAVKKEKITDQTSVISMAGKVPVVVDVDAFALQNAYELNYQPDAETVVALLDVGASTMTLNVLRGAEFIFTRDITIGGNHYSDFFQKDMQVTQEEAERLTRADFRDDMERQQAEKILRTVSEILALEIQKTVDYFKATSSTFDISKLYLSGGGCHIPGLKEHFQEKLQIPVEIFDSFRAIKQLPGGLTRNYLDTIAPDMAVAVGLALRIANE